MAILFEKLILSIMEDEIRENYRQFRFKSRSSINHAIFALRETIIHYRNKNKHIYACFLDFSKAFDKVNRQILLNKLKQKLNPYVWGALYDYYSKSTIAIRNNGTLLNDLKTTIGVKQGGPLSPKLFAVYVDELI